MNKSDKKLILIVFIIAILVYLVFKLIETNGKKIAKVYYENDLILTIDLPQNKNRKYAVKGYNGDVVIEVVGDKVRVIQEESPLHLCSKMGWIKDSFETIVCLPNKIVVSIESQSEVDTVIR